VRELLKVLLFDERGDCLVIRNEPVLPLTGDVALSLRILR
jgi:hypothetical protein